MRQTITCDNVDVELLNVQRLMLVNLLADTPQDNELWGLVYMLDDICDRAGVTEMEPLREEIVDEVGDEGVNDGLVQGESGV